MVKLLFALIVAGRPRQWIKNLAVFAAIIFTGQLFNFIPFQTSLWAFFIFCAFSSATYLFNDVLDIKRDQMHPLKISADCLGCPTCFCRAFCFSGPFSFGTLCGSGHNAYFLFDFSFLSRIAVIVFFIT